MTSHRALGFQVTFDDEDDFHRYAISTRDRGSIEWSRAGDARSSRESAAVVTLGPAAGSASRAVIHPAPRDSDLWGSIGPNDGLVLYREDEQIGTARVAWVHDMNRSLQPDELRMIVHWTQAGGQSPFVG
jgi:hypothetical protein